MGPGTSAAAERERSLQEAEAHVRAAAEARRRAAGFGVAADTEPLTAQALASLEPHGFVLLHDRRWPGTRRANLDHLAVGPGGVFVIDTKAWQGTIRVDAGSLLCDDEPRDEEVDKVLRQAQAVEAVVEVLGLAPLEVVPVLCFVRQGDVEERIGRVRLLALAALQRAAVRRGGRLKPDQVGRVVAQLEAECPPAEGLRLPAPPIAPPVAVPRPKVKASAQERLFSDQQLRMEALEAARRRPIEEWMAFLHPEQVKMVRRSFNGPCRIRGPVGTGKTVVGLHRAAYLAATRPGPLLFTTFVRTLPTVLRELYRRMAPDTVHRVEFTGLHRWAKTLLDDRGIPARGSPDDTHRAFDRAYAPWPGRHELETPETSYQYWKEEVHDVIKGRGLATFDEYVDLRRVGRKVRLTQDQRGLVWDLVVAYNDELRCNGICDANDILAMALRTVADDQPQPGYVAVVADEVQDLNLLGVKLLHCLVGDARDGLTLIGDGQQAIYPGGYTLAEAGISVAGRGAVLSVNYRNTQAVLDYAVELVADDDFEDLSAELERGRREVEIVRDGPAPIVVEPATGAEHDRLLLSAIRNAVGEGGRLGDMAVLAPTRTLVNRYRKVLREASVAQVSLEDYDGIASDAVKVGTFKRAKGLEFARVFLPQVALPERSHEVDPAQAERLERDRREYFVAMTRARDVLWVGYAPADIQRYHRASGGGSRP